VVAAIVILGLAWARHHFRAERRPGGPASA
jgi:hypothetical protein